MPIMVQNTTSFEERIMAANPEAAAPVELQPCDTCGRKFNPTALERHAKVRRLRLPPLLLLHVSCFTLRPLFLAKRVELFASKGQGLATESDVVVWNEDDWMSQGCGKTEPVPLSHSPPFVFRQTLHFEARWKRDLACKLHIIFRQTLIHCFLPLHVLPELMRESSAFSLS